MKDMYSFHKTTHPFALLQFLNWQSEATAYLRWRKADSQLRSFTTFMLGQDGGIIPPPPPPPLPLHPIPLYKEITIDSDEAEP